jgi:hypothetical protein
MATQCKVGDKPIIKYRFQGDTKDRIFKSKFAPIEVATKELPLESDGNYNGQGFGIGFVPLNGNGTFFWFEVLDFKIFQIPQGVDPTWGTTPRIALRSCGQASFSKLSDCSSSRSGAYVQCLNTSLFNGQYNIDPNRKCPTPKSGRCSIEIKYNGLILHQDQGNCPVSYSVQCGKCPDGQHECESKIYPYYCCNSCAYTAKKINNIANKIRG